MDAVNLEGRLAAYASVGLQLLMNLALRVKWNSELKTESATRTVILLLIYSKYPLWRIEPWKRRKSIVDVDFIIIMPWSSNPDFR